MNSKFLTLEDDEAYYNIGVSAIDLQVKQEQINKPAKGFINNPFFVSVKGGHVSKMTDKELYSVYKHIFLLCPNDNFNKTDPSIEQIFNLVVDQKKFTEMMHKNFTLVRASISMLRTNSFRKYSCLVTKDELSQFFHGDFDMTEIVVPMLELVKSDAVVNASLYDNSSTVTTLKTVLNLINFYNKFYRRPIIDQFSKLMSNIKESEFWMLEKNCNINMTKLFESRGFNYFELRDEHIKKSITATSKIHKENKEIETVINQLIEKAKAQGKKITMKKGDSFIDDIDDQNGKDDERKLSNSTNSFVHTPILYTDITYALSSSGKRSYYITQDTQLNLTKADITKLILEIDDETELYYVFNSLLVSKEYCHLVINNSEVLTKVQPLFTKHPLLYKFLLGYAWLSFVIEENIMKTKALKSDRFVFSIETAHKLPTFPYIYDDIQQNPYLPVLVDKTVLNPQQNACASYCISGWNGYGVCSLNEFRWRFNVFTTGDATKNIFNGIDWNYFAVSGSVSPACLQKRSPLIDKIKIPKDRKFPEDLRETQKWITYFDKYYKDSDIDLMCNDMSIYGFCEKAHDLLETLKKNIPD